MNNEKLVQEPKRRGITDRLFYGLSVFVIIAAALLLILAYVNAISNNKQQESLDESLKKTAQLTEEVKRLSEANIKLNQTSVNYSYCNAVLVAQYTQTLLPIQIKDLNACILQSFPDSKVSTGGSGEPTALQSSNIPVAQGSSAPLQSSAATNAATPNNTGGGTSGAPNPQQAGLQLTLPCLNALDLLTVGCSQ